MVANFLSAGRVACVFALMVLIGGSLAVAVSAEDQGA
jgi:hypothetical protein